MDNKNPTGFSSLAVMIILAFLIAAGGFLYYSNRNKQPIRQDQTGSKPKQEKAVEKKPQETTLPPPASQPSSAPRAKTTPKQEIIVKPPEAKIFNLTGHNFAFSLAETRVKKGDRVKINFESTGGFHDWTVEGYNIGTAQVNTGGKTSVELVADKAGVFEYFCSVGNHRQLGMVGKFIVE